MNYEFKKMDINHIQEFITWRHEGIYEFYLMSTRCNTPSSKGCGLGYQFVKDGIEFGRKTFGHGGSIKLCVANFNERAIKVYKKLGFKEI